MSCWSASRREAEQALADGQADLAICQANNRTLGSEMEWRALGTVDLRFYAAERLFADCARPLTLLNLSLVPQLVMHRRADEQIARRVQISGHTLYMNEKALLRHALQQGWVMPIGNRNVQTVLAEEIADSAQTALLTKAAFDTDLLLQTLDLISDHDMPDQSRARLHKAIGLLLIESSPASALNHLNHALQLNESCGVKKEKQQLERRLRAAGS